MKLNYYTYIPTIILSFVKRKSQRARNGCCCYTVSKLNQTPLDGDNFWYE